MGIFYTTFVHHFSIALANTPLYISLAFLVKIESCGASGVAIISFGQNRDSISEILLTSIELSAPGVSSIRCIFPLIPV
jgi:hypothetical protein